MATKTASTTFPMVLTMATGRSDKGQTANYRVYEGGGTVAVKNGKGENVIKNVIMGGNGTIYVANEVAGSATEFVLLPRDHFDRLLTGGAPKKGK